MMVCNSAVEIVAEDFDDDLLLAGVGICLGFIPATMSVNTTTRVNTLNSNFCQIFETGQITSEIWVGVLDMEAGTILQNILNWRCNNWSPTSNCQLILYVLQRFSCC